MSSSAAPDDFCSTYHILILWGRLVTCGRLVIGPAIFYNGTRRITNPPQVTNLPHTMGTNLRRSRGSGAQGSPFDLCLMVPQDANSAILLK